MRGAIPPLPNTPSWHGAWLSTGTTLPFLPYTTSSANKTPSGSQTRKPWPLLTSSCRFRSVINERQSLRRV
jgi:hypothetical protein